jgi:5-methylcytosine-specific restriction enzyme subunit McrC
LASPRGRLDLQTIARRGGETGTSLPCIHHHREENHPLNQALLSGLSLAHRLAGDRPLRLRLRRLADCIGERVSPIGLDHRTFRRLDAELNRMTRPYEPAVALIRLLAEGSGQSLEPSSPRVAVPGFFFDMNRFFQALLARFLADNLTGYTVRHESGLRGMVAYVPGWNLRGQPAPTPRPDFVVTKGTASVAVLDAKYRDLWENPLPREMLYQLALYATVHESGAATILYPTIHPQASEARIAIREPVRGGRRATISLRPVLLGRLESLVAARPTPSVSRERRELAQRLAFGAPDS